MKIYAPNIHLFAFQLYKGSNFDRELTKEEIQLWHHGNDIVKTTLQQPLNLIQSIVNIQDEPKGSRIDLIKPSQIKNHDYSIPFQGKIYENHQNNQNQKLLIKGFVSPIRIHDSYGLWLNLRRPEKDVDNKTPTKYVDISLLSKFNSQNCLTLIPDKTDQTDKLFLGQTLLITAWLTQEHKLNQTKPYDIAQECLKAIFPKPHNQPEFNQQAELFDSSIFEYGLFSQLENYQQVIVWLFKDKQADENFNKCYQELFDLFFFRSKIVKAFQDSRIIYHQITAVYDQIEKSIGKIEENTKSDVLQTETLNQLTNILKELSKNSLEYSNLLRNLKDYQNTIDINRNNYHEKLRQISAVTQDDNLSILETFYKENCEKFHKQINADIGYFEQGSNLLEQAIASIRGIVEIEQTKRDRENQEFLKNKEQKDKIRSDNLQTAIAILGFGLGAAQIGVSTAPYIIAQKEPPKSIKSPFTTSQIHPFVLSVLLSLIFGLIGAFVGWGLSRYITHRFKTSEDNSNQ